jgi:hypothetical protein
MLILILILILVVGSTRMEFSEDSLFIPKLDGF